MTKTKKFIFTIITVISLIAISTPSTTSAAPTKHEITRTITKLYYQADSGYYITETNRDKQGGFWTLDIVRVATKKENKELTKQLKQQYINKKVHIIYIENDQTDEEVEIIDSYVE